MAKIHLKRVTLLKDYRNLLKDLSIELQSVTILVGDQGAGKSSLLELLRDNSPMIRVDLTEYVIRNGINTYYFDTESMNPRIGSADDFTTPSGGSKGIGLGGHLQSKFMSHGEVLKRFSVDMLSKAKNSVIFIDEPEAALSLKNQYELIKSIEKAIDQNAQVIMSTHCLPIISHFEKVYDLENKLWVGSNEYVENIKNIVYLG